MWKLELPIVDSLDYVDLKVEKDMCQCSKAIR